MRIARNAVVVAAAVLTAAVGAGCATQKPAPIAAGELAEAQTFPYFKAYWTGRRFGRFPLAATDGRKSYQINGGENVYYGDCVAGKSSALRGSGCALPLQVKTTVYDVAFNGGLGEHSNVLLRGVPAVVFDGGNSIALYSGRLTIEVLSDDLGEALAAVRALRPVNAPGSAARPLPAPVYCPILTGPQPAAVQRAMHRLPGRACQRAAAALETNVGLFGKP